MTDYNFNAKIIYDNVHGSIGITELEQRIINTRTFQRLKKIKHLGLASFVFPGAEHSRFSHSIGVMHVMSQMIDKLKEEGCEYLKDDNGKIKQKLRLAALLHDIGHYPFSHLGEQVFKWVDEVQNITPVSNEPNSNENWQDNLLAHATINHKSDAATHEKLGELIVTSSDSEIACIINENEYDPKEIARIFNAEEKNNPFYSQLMSSTLDCDRMDYMLRDSHAMGTYYGRVDLSYLIQNLAWDSKEEKVCFYPKAITAIEHFIVSRYFCYNIIYHKTIIGFELMAKALFFAMIMDEEFNMGEYNGVVHSFADISRKMKEDDSFLANFNDEYFWYYLEFYNPEQEILQKLKNNLLTRTPLRPIADIRAIEKKSSASGCVRYTNLTKHLITHKEFLDFLSTNDINRQFLAITKSRIKFEKIEHAIEFDQFDNILEEDKLKLVKIKYKDGVRELLSEKGSIIRVLSKYKPCFARLYALINDPEKERKLKDHVEKIIGQE